MRIPRNIAAGTVDLSQTSKDDTQNNTGPRRQRPMAADAHWKSGTQSAAWKELWCRIFGNLLPFEEEKRSDQKNTKVDPLIRTSFKNTK